MVKWDEVIEMNYPKIARGATAVVYDMGDGKALKLFNEGYWRDAALREFHYARIVGEKGLPSPRVYEFVEPEGRVGIVYEKLEGPNMLDELLSGGDIPKLIADFGALQKKFHAARAPELRSLKLSWRESAARGGMERFIPLIDALPDGDQICHGDFHPANVILTPGGPVAIDFMNVCCGDAILDVARTIYLIEKTPSDDAPMELRRAISDMYLAHMGVARAQIEPIMVALMAARVSEAKVDVEREMLLNELSKVRFV